MFYKKNKIQIYSICVVIFFFILNTNFFKKTYLIFTSKNYFYSRILDVYDYCSKSGIGYVYYIKEKFGLKKSPQIQSFHFYPELYWIFNSTTSESSNYKIILFNQNIKNNKNKKNIFNEYKVLDNFQNSCIFLKK